MTVEAGKTLSLDLPSADSVVLESPSQVAVALEVEAHTPSGTLRALWPLSADDVEQETGLARQSRAGGKQDFVVCFQLLEEKAVVSHDTDFCAEAMEEMDEIVDKRIVVVDNNNFHKQEKGMSGGGGARFLTAGSA